MTKVGSRKLKNRLGSYLARAEKGETVLITRRGKPVVKLVPAEELAPAQSVEEWLRELAARGLIHLAPQRVDPLKFKPRSFKGKPLSRMIIEDRE